MVRFNYLPVICATICAMNLCTNLYSCVVTFFNNGSGSVLVLDHNTVRKISAPSSLALVSRGTSRRLGTSDKLAHFTIYTKSPKGNLFVSAYEVQQNNCAKNGNPYLTLSDIRNNTGDTTNLFTITNTSEHHTPMVRQLPNIQKADIYKQEPAAECSACQQ